MIWPVAKKIARTLADECNSGKISDQEADLKARRNEVPPHDDCPSLSYPLCSKVSVFPCSMLGLPNTCVANASSMVGVAQ